MNYLSPEAKEAIVLKVINRGSETVKSVAESCGISQSTISKWLRLYRAGKALPKNIKESNVTDGLSREQKFQHILVTAQIDEVSLGKYCREHGLYSHQLTQWRGSFMETQEDKNNQQQSEIITLKDKNKSLQRDLRRVEKALAEASALLVMKKKADLIWGAIEDD